MSGISSSHPLTQGDVSVLARRHYVGITSVLRRCLAWNLSRLTFRATVM